MNTTITGQDLLYFIINHNVGLIIFKIHVYSLQRTFVWNNLPVSLCYSVTFVCTCNSY